jgi:hypothetical protein
LNGILFARQAIPSFPLPILLNPKSCLSILFRELRPVRGTLKYLQASVFLADCNDGQSSSHFDTRRTNRGRRIYGRAGHIAVHRSDYYTEIDQTNATIDFCLSTTCTILQTDQTKA